MISITNGSVTYSVTKGAYESIYKPMGFHLVGEDVKTVIDEAADVAEAVVESSETVDEDPVATKSEDEKWCDEIRKKPISNWSKQELKRYADIMNVDLTGVESVRAVRSRISASWE